MTQERSECTEDEARKSNVDVQELKTESLPKEKVDGSSTCGIYVQSDTQASPPCRQAKRRRTSDSAMNENVSETEHREEKERANAPESVADEFNVCRKVCFAH